MAGLAAEAKQILESLRTGPKKRFGQNFMVSETHLRAIANALSAPTQMPVLEIGPGLGFLTRFLLERGYFVVAVEKDRLLAQSLKERHSQTKLSVITGDILEADPRKMGLDTEFAVAGNIPYNITTPILEWMIDRREWVREAVLTVQKEVAERLLARPGTKAWGSLTIFVRTFAEVTSICPIGRGAFLPPPNVDSAAIHIRFLRQLRDSVGSEALYFLLVRRAFQKRRKTILNALEGLDVGRDQEVGFLQKEELSKILQRLSIDPKRRPETLILSEWAKLSSYLSSESSA